MNRRTSRATRHLRGRNGLQVTGYWLLLLAAPLILFALLAVPELLFGTAPGAGDGPVEPGDDCGEHHPDDG